MGDKEKFHNRAGQIQWLKVIQELQRTSTSNKKIIALEETEREDYSSIIQVTKRL